MESSPHELLAIPFQESVRDRLADFSCGETPWARGANEWIRGSDVFSSMARGTRVWLFGTPSGTVVGFGSLGVSRWKWPPPDGSWTEVAIIPMLGVDHRFHGQPPDPAWRYSRQIIGFLIAEALELARPTDPARTPAPEWLVLMVHRDNAAAARCYERCGFEVIPGVERRHQHQVMKLWIGDDDPPDSGPEPTAT